jgi:hypothetical protein
MAEVCRFINVEAARRRKATEEADKLIENALAAAPSLFSSGRPAPAVPLQQALAEQVTKAADRLSRTSIEALVVPLNYGQKELTAEGVRLLAAQ